MQLLYLHEEEINLIIQVKSFAYEISKHQDQLHTHNYTEDNWKMYEFQIGL